MLPCAYNLLVLPMLALSAMSVCLICRVDRHICVVDAVLTGNASSALLMAGQSCSSLTSLWLSDLCDTFSCNIGPLARCLCPHEYSASDLKSTHRSKYTLKVLFYTFSFRNLYTSYKNQIRAMSCTSFLFRHLDRTDFH